MSADKRTRRDERRRSLGQNFLRPDRADQLVEAAGYAAGDLVTNPDLMAEALRDAPPGWQKKNLQLVLHVKVISGAPTSPKVVKTYFW